MHVNRLYNCSGKFMEFLDIQRQSSDQFIELEYEIHIYIMWMPSTVCASKCFDLVYLVSILPRHFFSSFFSFFLFGIERHCECVKYCILLFFYLLAYLFVFVSFFSSLSILCRLTLSMRCDCNLHTVFSIACGMNVCIFCYLLFIRQ